MRIFSARIAFLLFFLIISFSLVVPCKTFAQTSVTNANLRQNTSPDIPKNLHTWTQNVMIEVMSAMGCQLTGIDPTDTHQACLGADKNTGKIGFLPVAQSKGGAIGQLSMMIGSLYTPPVHLTDYTRYLSQNFGLSKQTYAASTINGVGFDGISPLIPLWVTFRNIVFMIFTILFVIIGLAIMLRVKIDPKTVMSVENQLPKIVIALILITFSFAIAGFLIDLMYVVIYVVINTFAGADPNGINPTLISQNINIHPLGFLDKVFTPTGVNAAPLPGPAGFLTIVFNSAQKIGLFMGNLAIPYQDWFSKPATCNAGVNCLEDKIGSILIVNVITNVVGGLFGIIVGALAFIIIAAAVIWAMFRLWFALLTAYVYILIDIVFAPFYIGLEVFPGGPLGFGVWIRDIIANLSSFAVAILMFLLGKTFMDFFTNPKIVSPFAPPLLGGSPQGQDLGALIGLGIILITPQVVTMMKEYLKAPSFKYTTAIGQAIGVGSAAPGRLGEQVASSVFGQYSPTSGKMIYQKSPLGTFARILGIPIN